MTEKISVLLMIDLPCVILTSILCILTGYWQCALAFNFATY